MLFKEQTFGIICLLKEGDKMNNINNLIFIIRDKQVMLDSDVAKLYGYETKRINETVRRNLKRFPNDFCFQLTENEYTNIISLFESTNELINNSSQIATSSTYKHRGSSYLPYAFTEQGIAMLSGLLKNDIAIEVSINIMKAFVEMRKFISNNDHIFERLTSIEYKMLNYDRKFDELFDYLQKDKEFKQKIFYDGQIYDAHSLVIDIILKANNNIIIIDNYIDKTILDLLSKKKKDISVRIITNQTTNKLSNMDISKFNKQYPKLELEYNNTFHDRFIIIDDVIYHLGASIKDLGKKCFAINVMNDKSLLNKLEQNKTKYQLI